MGVVNVLINFISISQLNVKSRNKQPSYISFRREIACQIRIPKICDVITVSAKLSAQVSLVRMSYRCKSFSVHISPKSYTLPKQSPRIYPFTRKSTYLPFITRAKYSLATEITATEELIARRKFVKLSYR